MYFAGRPIHEITTPELDRWVRSLNVSGTTRNSYKRVLGVLFGLALGKVGLTPASILCQIFLDARQIALADTLNNPQHCPLCCLLAQFIKTASRQRLKVAF